MKRILVDGLVLVAVATVAVPAAAQYKWRSPEGTVVYSDVPPATGARLMGDRSAEEPSVAVAEESAPAQVQLPYELKLARDRFPVVLYTADGCAPCASARQHLASRGVPYSERTIGTAADFDAFKALGFSDNSFPAMTVGRERLVGFETGAYDRVLNAAGYPRTSQLPKSYKQAAAVPMTPPAPQKLTVTVQRETVTEQAPSAARDNLSAIEQYRRQVQAGAAARAPDPTPSIRF
ncbi:MAG: glutaredoxin family protein [Burkholderiaceae bacterium]|nr:glutaredoxin family protein [Burkholderiaceae bacterium]